MKINKNIITFAICLAMFYPTKPSEENNETIQIVEIISQNISSQDAAALLQELANNLEDGNKFKVDNTIYSVSQDIEIRISPESENLLIAIMTQVLNSAITSIAGEIQSMQTHVISKEEAIAILEACANSLVAGSQFELNDTTYTIEGSNKTTEDVETTINNDTTSND